MTLYFRIITFSLFISYFSCKTTSNLGEGYTPDQKLSSLASLMSGHFNSANQAAEDSSFFDISLSMIPIWKYSEEAKWLYVEQAVTAMLDKPYRQRVYRLSVTEKGIFESRVYELPNPDRYIHAWDQLSLFEALTPDSLITREGCAVYLESKGPCFAGSTREADCKSTLRGASYATSMVEICPGKITSWDQGWSSDAQQVWGAVKGGYVFVKQKE